jgi:uncharacterized protein (DUF433 family)
MKLPDFLTQDVYGEIRMTGHRIGLYTVMRCYKEGYSAERIAEEFPSLPLELIKKVIAFALDNWDEVNEYVEAYRAEIARQEALPPGPGVLKIRRYMELIEKADEERKGDPNWERLSVIEKLLILQPDAVQKDSSNHGTSIPAG